MKIRLLAERGFVQPGEEIWIATEQSIREGWHTYWKNPGDSGTAPKITWTLPTGASVSEIYWPTPEKFPYGPLLNYGYKNNVILLQKLKLPDILPAGKIELSADIEILVCAVECIPEYGTYKLILNGDDAQSENNQNYLSTARAKLPQTADWDSDFKVEDGVFKLEIKPSNKTVLVNLTPEMIDFFPVEWGLVSNKAAPKITFEDDEIHITQDKGERSDAQLDQLKSAPFIIVLGKGANRYAYEINADHDAGFIQALLPASESTPEKQGGPSFLYILLLALLGGLILNLMPCVFPVLSIKALSLVKIADQDPAAARKHGVYYTLGIVLSFLLIASVLIGLKAGGAEIGWGFQLQNPIVVALLCYLLFIIGLNFFGFFEFSGRFTNIGSRLTQGESYSASFFTGVLATLVATPCTAPFMGVAVGYALTQSALVALIVFAVLGFGLALPYLVLSFSPALERMLPKPGAWMEKFKQLLAFPIFLSAAWLAWVVAQQSGPIGVLYILGGIILITFALWILRDSSRHIWQKIVSVLVMVIAVSLLALLPVMPKDLSPSMQATSSLGEQAYSPTALEAALATDQPVFVEMTAAWCITCKVNHATSINIEATKKLFASEKVIVLIGDWTHQDAEITKYLASFGRNGVPFYVFYGRPDATGKRPAPATMPEILTPGIVADTVKGSNNKGE